MINPKLDEFWDRRVHETRFRCVCRRCSRRFHTCKTPAGAYRAAVRKGYDLNTGLCRLCFLEVAKELQHMDQGLILAYLEGEELRRDPLFQQSLAQAQRGEGVVLSQP